jgi:hypothetical protein
VLKLEAHDTFSLHLASNRTIARFREQRGVSEKTGEKMFDTVVFIEKKGHHSRENATC